MRERDLVSYDWKAHETARDGESRNPFGIRRGAPEVPEKWADDPIFQTLAAAEMAHAAGNLEDEEGALSHAASLAGADFVGSRRRLFYDRVEWLRAQGRLESGDATAPRRATWRRIVIPAAIIGVVVVFGFGTSGGVQRSVQQHAC